MSLNIVSSFLAASPIFVTMFSCLVILCFILRFILCFSTIPNDSKRVFGFVVGELYGEAERLQAVLSPRLLESLIRLARAGRPGRPSRASPRCPSSFVSFVVSFVVFDYTTSFQVCPVQAHARLLQHGLFGTIVHTLP